MARRKAPEKTELTTNCRLEMTPFMRELIAATAVLLAIFMWLGIQDYSAASESLKFGYIGDLIIKLFAMTFGKVALLVPTGIVIWAIHLLWVKKMWSSRMTGVALIVLSIATYYSLEKIPKGLTPIEAAGYHMGGGYIGASVATLFSMAMGEKGSIFLWLILLVAGILLLVQHSARTFILCFRNGFSETKNNLREFLFYEVEESEDEDSEKVVDEVTRIEKSIVDPADNMESNKRGTFNECRADEQLELSKKKGFFAKIFRAKSMINTEKETFDSKSGQDIESPALRLGNGPIWSEDESSEEINLWLSGDKDLAEELNKKPKNIISLLDGEGGIEDNEKTAEFTLIPTSKDTEDGGKTNPRVQKNNFEDTQIFFFDSLGSELSHGDESDLTEIIPEEVQEDEIINNIEITEQEEKTESSQMVKNAKASRKLISEKSVEQDTDGDQKNITDIIEKDEQIVPVKPIYVKPNLNLLFHNNSKCAVDKNSIINTSQRLEQALAEFGVKVKVEDVSCGPAVTRYEMSLAPGTKVSKIVGLSDDLQLHLAASGIRIEAPIPGKSAVGIEIPNNKVSSVGLYEILSSNNFSSMNNATAVAFGKDISGNAVCARLKDMPHLLIAGSTGSGKSVCINGIIMSILFNANPDEVKMVMIDPKMVELSVYNNLPHLMTPVVTNPKRAAQILQWMTNEMEKRYSKFAAAGVREIERYREATNEPMPYIVIIIDELADLMMVASNEVEDSICRLAQKARAAGMHLIVATQRPSVDVVTGIIKANIPSRIAFAVSSQIDSRTILDMSGAEKLLGKGDMLFYPVGSAKPKRVQGAFVSDEEIERTVAFIIEQNEHQVQYNQELLNLPDPEASKNNKGFSNEDNGLNADEELMREGVKIFLEAKKVSSSLLQRRLRIGFSRAARLVDMMEERGIVSGIDSSNKRMLLVKEDYFERLAAFKGEDTKRDV